MSGTAYAVTWFVGISIVGAIFVANETACVPHSTKSNAKPPSFAPKTTTTTAPTTKTNRLTDLKNNSHAPPIPHRYYLELQRDPTGRHAARQQDGAGLASRGAYGYGGAYDDSGESGGGSGAGAKSGGGAGGGGGEGGEGSGVGDEMEFTATKAEREHRRHIFRRTMWVGAWRVLQRPGRCPRPPSTSLIPPSGAVLSFPFPSP